MSQPEIIVLEPAGKQKKYTLKPHGNLDKVQKRWKSHLKNIGASWSDKKKLWTLSRDKLRDFEKVQSIMSKEPQDLDEDTNKDKEKEKKKQQRKRKQSSPDVEESEEESQSEEEEESEDESSGDEEIIEFLKNKIKTLSTSTHDKTIEEDVDNSEDEDVIRISRRLRYIMGKLKSMDRRVSELEEENAFLNKQMATLLKN
jgi:hypothetical protein